MRGERAATTSFDIHKNRRIRVAKTIGVISATFAVVAASYSMEQPNNQQDLPTEQAAAIVQTTPEITLPSDSEWSVMPGLADPDIYKASNNSYYLSGTAPKTTKLPIYHSIDLTSFDLVTEYRPSSLDPNHDYCNLWAPDLTKSPDGNMQIFFTAKQLKKGQPCDSSNHEQTIFYATAPGDSIAFGKPEMIKTNDSSTPRSYVGKNCLPSGCANTMRIDPEVVDDQDGNRWLFYNWFGQGQNVISTVNIDNASEHHQVARPSKGESNINEAPDVFEREGEYYMVYSRNFYDSNYGLSYIKADSISELTKTHGTSHALANAKTDSRGKTTENIGHSSVTEYNGEYYIFYHKGEFDRNGNYLGRRDTYSQQLHFDNTGDIEQLSSPSTQHIVQY